jgi:hypothetical protein
MLVVAIRARKPFLGCLIASMIHTTFVVLLLFSIVDRLLRRWRGFATLACIVVAIAVAFAGRELFEIFGGRRLFVYSIDDGSTSLNFAIGCLICAAPSVALLCGNKSERQRCGAEILSIATMHIGVTVFLVSSVLVFPLGASRVGYFSELLLIPVLPVLKRDRGYQAAAFWGTALFLGYSALRAAAEGAYAVLAG